MNNYHIKYKLLSVIPIVAVTMLILLTGCTGEASEITTDLGQEVELKIGQTVVIEDEGLGVKFAEVVTDSRCPYGATCVWQGEVTCILDITYLDSTYQKTIIQPGLTQEPAKDVFQDYELAFNVEPYPELGKDIKNNEYRLKIVIERDSALSGGILVTFDVEGEEYKIFIKNEETIADILALQRGESQARIPSGRIIGEPASYNAPWSWHIDPMDIHMAEFTIELCDGLPSHVEGDLDYWVNTVGRFCPWSAEIIEIQDYR